MFLKYLSVILVSHLSEIKGSNQQNEKYYEGFIAELANYETESINSFENNICIAALQTESTEKHDIFANDMLFKMIEFEIEKLTETEIFKKVAHYKYACLLQKDFLKPILSSLAFKLPINDSESITQPNLDFLSRDEFKQDSSYIVENPASNESIKSVVEYGHKSNIYIDIYEDKYCKHNKDDFKIIGNIFEPLLAFIDKNELMVKHLNLFFIKLEDNCIRKALIDFIVTQLSAKALKLHGQVLYYPEFKFNERIAHFIDSDKLRRAEFHYLCNLDFIANSVNEKIINELNQLQDEQIHNVINKSKQLNCRIVEYSKCLFKIIDYHSYVIDETKHEIIQSYDLLYSDATIVEYNLKVLSNGWCKDKVNQQICKIIISDNMKDFSTFVFKYKVYNNIKIHEYKTSCGFLFEFHEEETYKRYCNVKKLLMMYVYNEIDVMKQIINTTNDYKVRIKKNETTLHTKTSLFKFLYFLLKKLDEHLILKKKMNFNLLNLIFTDCYHLNDKYYSQIVENAKLHLLAGTTSDKIQYDPISIETNKSMFDILTKNKKFIEIDEHFTTSIDLIKKVFIEYFYIREFGDRESGEFYNFISFFLNFVEFFEKHKVENQKKTLIGSGNGLDVNKIRFQDLKYNHIYKEICDTIKISEFVEILIDANQRRASIQNYFKDVHGCQDIFESDSCLKQLADIIQSNDYTIKEKNNHIKKFCRWNKVLEKDFRSTYIYFLLEFECVASKANLMIWKDILASNFDFYFSFEKKN